MSKQNGVPISALEDIDSVMRSGIGSAPNSAVAPAGPSAVQAVAVSISPFMLYFLFIEILFSSAWTMKVEVFM